MRVFSRYAQHHGCLGLLLLAACTAGPAPGSAAPEASTAGCYVVLQVEQTGGAATDFLFPGFFSLDTISLPDAAVAGKQVLLPRDDLSRRAGSWSWTERPDSIVLSAVTPTQGWRLGLVTAGGNWRGHLGGWADSVTVTWTLGGRRANCPDGLVPAAH